MPSARTNALHWQKNIVPTTTTTKTLLHLNQIPKLLLLLTDLSKNITAYGKLAPEANMIYLNKSDTKSLFCQKEVNKVRFDNGEYVQDNPFFSSGK